jgi:hypothetical protein
MGAATCGGPGRLRGYWAPSWARSTVQVGLYWRLVSDLAATSTWAGWKIGKNGPDWLSCR